MKKIAIPITKDNKVADHFGRCKYYEIYTFSNTNEILDLKLLESDGKCGCKSNIVSVLVKECVTFMLAGNIGDSAKSKLVVAGVDVVRGCSGKSADLILEFVEGKISDTDVSCTSHDHKHKKGHAHACHH